MHLKIYSRSYIQKYIRKRIGEIKLGEVICTLNPKLDIQKQLAQCKSQFVLLGLPEEIGVRANYGRGGTHGAWESALSYFLNIQSNDFLGGEELLVLGHVNFDKLIKSSSRLNLKTENGIKAIRKIVAEVDTYVIEVIRLIVASGKTPIIIGGGHNNSYGNIVGTVLGLQDTGKLKHKKINVINLDAHMDFRPLEGRHSGNGFSYAFHEGYLDKYAVVGVHESYVTRTMLAAIKRYIKNINVSFFEDIFIAKRIAYRDAVDKAIRYVDNSYFGVELDVDAIQNISASAETPSGVTSSQARQFMMKCGKNKRAAYLHITEAATDANQYETNMLVGKLITYLVADFIKSALAARRK